MVSQQKLQNKHLESIYLLEESKWQLGKVKLTCVMYGYDNTIWNDVSIK